MFVHHSTYAEFTGTVIEGMVFRTSDGISIRLMDTYNPIKPFGPNLVKKLRGLPLRAKSQGYYISSYMFLYIQVGRYLLYNGYRYGGCSSIG